MKFRNPRTGDIYDFEGKDCSTNGFCSGVSCLNCPIRRNRGLASCRYYVLNNPNTAAALMGYEVIEDKEEFIMENYIVINGKKAELTQEQLEKLGIVVGKNQFDRDADTEYFFISPQGDVERYIDGNFGVDIARHKNANYCRDENILKQRALHETLSRLLWRYSMTHGGDEIDWGDENTDKWRIYYGNYGKQFCVMSNQSGQAEGAIYFNSCDIAESAIKEIIEPFMCEHPDFVW